MLQTLTIAIPTYNRIDILIANLRVLIPQLFDGVELLVIDNDSTNNVEDAIRQEFDGRLKYIRFVRNLANVGGDQNFLRCIEFAKSKYVWVLGDDDIILSDAVKSVWGEIKENPDALVINMYSPSADHAVRHASKICLGAKDYLCSSDSLGELIFISTMVINVEAAKKHLSKANFYQFTSSPQLVLVVEMLAHNGLSIISNKVIFDEIGQARVQESDSWMPIKIIIGIYELQVLTVSDDVLRQIDILLSGHWVRKITYSAILSICVLLLDNRIPNGYARRVVRKILRQHIITGSISLVDHIILSGFYVLMGFGAFVRLYQYVLMFYKSTR